MIPQVGSPVQFPPIQTLGFKFLFQEAFLASFMQSLCQNGNNSNHLPLFFPHSLFFLQSDEMSLVSFAFGKRQIHFLIFSHAQHSKKTAHGGDQNTSLKQFLLILFFVITLFLIFLQHHGNIVSKLGCQHCLKRDEGF